MPEYLWFTRPPRLNPASLESSSSVRIFSIFGSSDFWLTDFWSPPDCLCFSFAFAWTLQPAWKVRHRCGFVLLFQISAKAKSHPVHLVASLSPLPGSRFSFSLPIRNMPYFSLQGRFRRFYLFGIRGISVSSCTRSMAFCWPLDYQSALDYLKLR